MEPSLELYWVGMVGSTPQGCVCVCVCVCARARVCVEQQVLLTSNVLVL